jgi:hypothetical protein
MLENWPTVYGTVTSYVSTVSKRTLFEITPLFPESAQKRSARAGALFKSGKGELNHCPKIGP